MDKREILQQIIDHGGDCSYIPCDGIFSDMICPNCPLSRLKKNPDGTYMSCYDSLTRNKHHPMLDLSVVDKIYYDKAVEILQNILMEDMLTGETDACDS